MKDKFCKMVERMLIIFLVGFLSKKDRQMIKDKIEANYPKYVTRKTFEEKCAELKKIRNEKCDMCKFDLTAILRDRPSWATPPVTTCPKCGRTGVLIFKDLKS